MSDQYTDDFLPERRPNGTVFLSIYEGKLCQRRATPAEGFVEYTSRSEKSKGKISYIKEFDHIEGYVVGFEKKEKETLDKKKYWVARITFMAQSGREAILEVPVRSDFVGRFAKCVENMDLTERLFVRVFPDKHTVNSSVMFKQKGEKIEQKYTVENPNGLPQWEKDPITQEWDNRDYWKFLFNIIHSKIEEFERVKVLLTKYQEEIPAPEGANALEPSSDEVAATATKAFDDDIPF